MQHSIYNQQRHIRRRMALTILFLVGMLAILCDCAPTGTEAKAPSLEHLADSTKNPFSERIGSPIELAWQAWLILSKSEKGPLLSEDPATLVRRITPKSIFIAPELNSGCSGQNYDENRCKYIKTINVNSSLQRKFLLDRLNAMHDRQKQQEQQEQQEQGKVYDVAGPFQLNIPFNDKGANRKTDDTPSKVPEIPKPVVTSEATNSDKKSERDQAHVGAEAGFEGVTTMKIQVPEEHLPEHVPVVDFVHEEVNESFPDSVVDYKIPSTAKRVDEKEKSEDDGDALVEELDNEERLTTTSSPTSTTTTATHLPPTLIVLFDTSTKAPIANDSSIDQIIRQTNNLTGNWTNKESLNPVIPIAEDAHESHYAKPTRNVTHDTVEFNATQENDDIYSDEEPSVTDEEEIDNLEDYSTEDSITESTDDDFAETTEDELLRPGEAGMTIPIITNQQYNKVDWQKHDSVGKTTTETTEVASTEKSLNESFNLDGTEVPTTLKPEDGDVNVSSEVSINGDFILETTLIDVNTEKIKNTTESATNADFVTVKVDNDETPAFDSEKELLPKPEVVFSTSSQEKHPQPPQPSISQVKPVIVWGVDEETAKRQQQTEESNNPLKLNLGLTSFQKDDTIAEQASFNSEKIVLPPIPNFKPQNLGLVRFPNFEERPHSSSYVRFPSDEVNSIHNLDLKPRQPPTHDEYLSTTSTKSSVPFYQKQWHWNRGFRTDRQHSGFKQHWSESNRQAKVFKQQSNPQDFWAKLSPVSKLPSTNVPDTAHLSTTSHGSNNEPHGGGTSRRSRFKPT